MGKKKSSGRNGAGGALPKLAKPKPAPVQPLPAASDTAEITDLAAARAGVGRGSLAEHVLDSLELAMGELQRAHREVAALGKSLALAREQLVEQEDELELLRDSAAT